MENPQAGKLRFGIGVTIAYALIWSILSRGDSNSWVIGFPALIIAVFISIKLYQPSAMRWRLLGLLRFIPYFMWQSVLGGIAVAKLAFRKSLVLNSVTLEYRVRLPDVSSRVFMSSAASLLPGTLVMDVRGDLFLVHVIDDTIDAHAEFDKLQSQIARVFDLNLETEEIQ